MNFNAPSMSQVPKVLDVNSLENRYPELNFIDRPDISSLPPFQKTELIKVMQSIYSKMSV